MSDSAKQKRDGPHPPPPPGPQEGPRHRRAAPPRGVPLEPAHRAQVIDDRRRPHARRGLDRSRPTSRAGGTGNVDAATEVGTLVAERAKAAGVDKVVFDRGGFLYHGRVAAVADAAREAGLEF